MSAGLGFVPPILSLLIGLVVSLITGDYGYSLTGLSLAVVYVVLLLLYAMSDWKAR